MVEKERTKRRLMFALLCSCFPGPWIPAACLSPFTSFHKEVLSWTKVVFHFNLLVTGFYWSHRTDAVVKQCNIFAAFSYKIFCVINSSIPNFTIK